jgi:hypothetical protein
MLWAAMYARAFADTFVQSGWSVTDVEVTTGAVALGDGAGVLAEAAPTGRPTVATTAKTAAVTAHRLAIDALEIVMLCFFPSWMQAQIARKRARWDGLGGQWGTVRMLEVHALRQVVRVRNFDCVRKSTV